MALAALNSINEIAYEAGVFNWPMEDGSYTNPDGTTVSFHLVGILNGAPIGQYIAGEVNSFNLINNATGNIAGLSTTDSNKNLFNTSISANTLMEKYTRKYNLNKIPFANYDQPVDLGNGSQTIQFVVAFVGTQYQTALINCFQCLFNNAKPGLGTLNHIFYNKIKNVLPISMDNDYTYQKLNFVSSVLTFITSDISHMSPSTLSTTITAEISKWYIGIENAVLSLGGTVSALSSMGKNISSGLL